MVEVDSVVLETRTPNIGQLRIRIFKNDISVAGSVIWQQTDSSGDKGPKKTSSVSQVGRDIPFEIGRMDLEVSTLEVPGDSIFHNIKIGRNDIGLLAEFRYTELGPSVEALQQEALASPTATVTDPATGAVTTLSRAFTGKIKYTLTQIGRDVAVTITYKDDIKGPVSPSFSFLVLHFKEWKQVLNLAFEKVGSITRQDLEQRLFEINVNTPVEAVVLEGEFAGGIPAVSGPTGIEPATAKGEEALIDAPQASVGLTIPGVPRAPPEKEPGLFEKVTSGALIIGGVILAIILLPRLIPQQK